MASANQVDLSLLDTGLGELQQKGEWSPEVVSELRKAIVEGTDLDLFRVNPVRYAATRLIEEAESIDLFLNAVDVGLFDME